MRKLPFIVAFVLLLLLVYCTKNLENPIDTQNDGAIPPCPPGSQGLCGFKNQQGTGYF